MASVDLKGYGFRYLRRKTPALRDLTLSIEPGTVVAVVGKAGAGKTTFVKALMGIVPHIEPGYVEGEIHVAGRDVRQADVAEMSHHVSIVLENPEIQIFSLTVKDDIAFGPANLGLPRDEIWKRVNYAIQEAELSGFEERNPTNLSGGEQQSLALAGALAMMPSLLVLDEPVSMLDPLGKERVMTIMERVAKGATQATTLVTESGADIEALAGKVDRVIALHEGQILAEGGPEILADARLEGIGVGRPQVAELFSRLHDAGLAADDIPITFESGAEATRRLLVEGGVRQVSVPPGFGAARNGRSFGEPVIRIDNLHHVYPPNIRALRGVSLGVRAGQIVGVIGQNGSGKTTMARHLVGLLKPSNKDCALRVLDRNIARMSIREIIRLVNYVFQNPDDQIFAHTVREEIAFAPEMMELPLAEREPLIEEALATFHLKGHEDDYTLSLPEDLKTYLSIASIYPLKPTVLIIDEPTTGLDTHGERKMMQSLLQLRQAGHTLMIITHNMKTVGQYCDWVIVMNRGEVLMEGPTREVYSQPEALLEADIRPPQITRLGQALGEFGFPPAVLTVDEMAQILLHNLRPRGA